MHSDLQELIEAAQGRDKANIGLIRRGDLDATMLYLIGSRAYFDANPIKFDVVFNQNQVGSPPYIMLGFPTEQKIGLIEDQPVLQIVIPDIEAPSLILKTAEVKGIVEQLIFVGSWLLTRRFNTLVVNHVILQIQVKRLERARLAALNLGLSQSKRARAASRSARLTRSVTKRSTRQAKLIRKFKRPLRFLVRLGVKAVLRVFIVVGLIIDIIVVTDAVIKGARRAGISGAVGALVGGVAEALSLGLATPLTDKLAGAVEQRATEEFGFPRFGVPGG